VDRQLPDGDRRAIFALTYCVEGEFEINVRGKGKRKTRDRPAVLAIAVALVGLVLLAAPLPAFSQSCALCYTQAASAGTRMIQALRSEF